ncbi:MAG: GNAT family N-acetyltransferase [Bacteroidia bacterium]|nr:GNAT family N-acetyltransferase [Bacteroidia bacterium]
MNEEIQIVLCSKGDIPEVVSISHALSADGLVNALNTGELQKGGENNYTIVAKFADQVVGFAVSSYSWGKLHIEELGVKKEMQRKGIGKKLVEHLITHTKKKKLPEVYCEVKAKNIASLKLFLSLGFIERLFFSLSDDPFYGLYLPI